jgi:hypothetical protein
MPQPGAAVRNNKFTGAAGGEFYQQI